MPTPRKRKADGEPVDADDDGDAKRAMMEHLETEIQGLTPEGVVEVLDEQFERWGVMDANATFADVASRAFRNFGIPGERTLTFEDPGLTFADMDLKAWKEEARALLLLEKVREYSDDLPGDQYGRTGRVLEAIFYAKKLVFAAIFARHSADAATRGSDAPNVPQEMDNLFGSWGLRFRWIGEGIKDLTNMQNLLLYLLDSAQERGYRKHGDSIMTQILSADNVPTRAWTVHSTVTQFVDVFTAKETNWQAWVWKTSTASMREQVIEHLAKADDYQLPNLERDRSTFSFRNGIYRARQDKFCKFQDVGSSIAAAKYFNADFPEACADMQDWRRIPTPHIESVMESQDWDTDVREWLFVLFGRLLYDVGDLDGWQIIPFLLGLAGTGKSLLTTKVAKAFYEAADCGVLGNNVEKRFGLSAFYDKLLFIAPELRHDLQLDQAEFQSLVSGEELMLAQKFKTATAVKWRPPGVLAGNEVPGWADASGSITRRIVVFDFGKPVTNPDMTLEKKLEHEIPSILVKANRAYLERAAAIGHQSVWKHLPAYFKRNQSKMAAETNSIEAFIVSGGLKFDKDIYMPFETFKKLLKAYESNNGYKSSKLTLDLFRTPFARHSLSIRRDCLLYENQRRLRDYVVGCDIVDQEIAEFV
jgi:phage/plasmid-associated DNA primase